MMKSVYQGTIEELEALSGNLNSLRTTTCDYERAEVTARLLGELAKGEESGGERGWFSSEEVEERLRLKEWYNGGD